MKRAVYLFLIFACKLSAYDEEILFENEQIGVYKWRLMPNESVGKHCDENPQVVIPLMGGTVLRIAEDGSTSEVILQAGTAVFQERDSELHDATNISPRPIEAITIEIKKIIERQNFDCLLDYADPETLIICDIDNTLIESALHMGSAQWRDHIRNKARKLGHSEDEVETILDQFWLFAQFFVPVRLVDQSAPSVLSKLQALQIPVIALTAREPIESSHTEKQLRSVGLNFKHLAGSYEPFLPEGIIFCGEDTKDAALAAFFQKMGHLPKRVVFIDDQLEQLKAIDDLLQNLRIEFVGIRFSGADARVKAFDPAIADLQWGRLPTILSDQEAKSLQP